MTGSHGTVRGGIAAVSLVLGLSLASWSFSGWRGAKVNAAEDVMWRRQVAPIVYKNCASCHHAGGSGPFALTTYEDAKRWGSLMKDVTQSRYMPPWLPAPGAVHFQGDRRLSSEDVAMIAAWVRDGMKEGTGAAPVAPVYQNEWALGTPDMVLEMPASMEVPASGTDLFENFALPVALDRTRWVRAMEIKPGSQQVTHHANVIIDRTASVRRAHPADWQKGIPGMDILIDSGDGFDPDSHFLFWKPDSTALVEPEGMPWRLDPGNDLVLNMHLKPTGKPETIRAKIGLYFTDKPATAKPMLLQLENDAALKIAAGDKAFVVEDELKLPVAVEVLGIYPHAHYLGKRMEAWATLPSGERRTLVTIEDWDIDRQSVYRLEKPLALPKGSVVHMRYTYDNSAENVRNPNSPPVAVTAGNRSADEMAHFWLQVLPVSTSGSDPRIALERAWMEHRLAKNPSDGLAEYNVASLTMQEGHAAEAAKLYDKLLAEHPGDARTLTSLGSALDIGGDVAGARREYREAVRADASYTDAAFDLGAVDLKSGEFAEAETTFRGLLVAQPNDAAARAGLGEALVAEGETAQAKAEFERVLVGSPGNFEALYGLAGIELQASDAQGAEGLLTRALAERDDADAHRLMALADAGEGALDKAAPQLEAWKKLAPGDPEPRRALAQVYEQLGRVPEALEEQRAVTKSDAAKAADWNDLGVMEARGGDKVAARGDFERALKMEPGNEAAMSNLRRLQ